MPSVPGKRSHTKCDACMTHMPCDREHERMLLPPPLPACCRTAHVRLLRSRTPEHSLAHPAHTVVLASSAPLRRYMTPRESLHLTGGANGRALLAPWEPAAYRLPPLHGFAHSWTEPGRPVRSPHVKRLVAGMRTSASYRNTWEVDGADIKATVPRCLHPAKHRAGRLSR
jgi:hypothetical protein